MCLRENNRKRDQDKYIYVGQFMSHGTFGGALVEKIVAASLARGQTYIHPQTNKTRPTHKEADKLADKQGNYKGRVKCYDE